MSDRRPDAHRPSERVVKQVYLERLTRRLAEARRHSAHERAFGLVRLVTFLAMAWLGWVSLVSGRLSPLVLIAPAALFIALIIRHNQVIASRRRLERAAVWYTDGLARLEGTWRSSDDGAQYVTRDHPYAMDLDLTGPDGLVARISIARTVSGRETLVRWLTTTADAETVRARQASTRELRERVDLREDLAVLGEETASRIDAGALVAWGSRPRAFEQTWPRVLAIVSTLVTVVGLVLLVRGPWPFLAPVALLAHGALAFAFRGPIADVLSGVDEPARELTLLAGFTDRLEREPFHASRLRELASTLEGGEAPATAEIAHLARLVDLLDSAHNTLFAPIALLLHWRLHLAHAIDAWRARHGGEIATWIATIGEMEALSVLGGYAYENPENVYAEIVETPGLSAEALGHPFLPLATCVTNDVTLERAQPLLVVSGSNMSGKSTLLRSVGVNVALALAGAPVRASRLRLSPLVLGASLRVADSLVEGRSRFFAEVERLKRLVDLSHGEIPLLFLVDELLGGTNSHDRRVGAEAVMRTLVGNGASGIFTTHDLALTEIAESLPEGRNAHFEDHMENGRMAFDYTLRPGVVTKSNAVALMRSVGLDV